VKVLVAFLMCFGKDGIFNINVSYKYSAHIHNILYTYKVMQTCEMCLILV